MKERIRTAKKHLTYSLKWKGNKQGIYEMRRHYTNYFKGITNFKPYRSQLVQADDPGEVTRILDEIGTVFGENHVPGSW
jgi:tRNA-dihydrouridine synthase